MGEPVSFSENYVTSLALKGLALDDADDEVAELVAIVLQLVAQAVDGLSISEAWPPAQSVGEQFLDKEYGLLSAIKNSRTAPAAMVRVVASISRA